MPTLCLTPLFEVIFPRSPFYSMCVVLNGLYTWTLGPQLPHYPGLLYQEAGGRGTGGGIERDQECHWVLECCTTCLSRQGEEAEPVVWCGGGYQRQTFYPRELTIGQSASGSQGKLWNSSLQGGSPWRKRNLMFSPVNACHYSFTDIWRVPQLKKKIIDNLPAHYKDEP